MALFNYAFARRHGGQFILRIEDTDRVRSTRESERDILDALRWLGLDWDEGPDKGGPDGPYRQSERFQTYREHAARLVQAGEAYPCFCTAERLDELRRRQTETGSETVGYDGRCSVLDPADAARRVAAGEPYVIRLRVPREGDCVMRDRLRGEIRIPWAMIDDQVLIKSDGFPTYHLANVVDDHAMRITHVIRGEEWISSLPKHVRLYAAFGWTPPEFAHLPLLRNPDKSKLSKRKNPTSILYYRRAGFLPEALINFLGLMAYSPADGAEVFSLANLCDTFDLDRVSLGGPIFDLVKLRAFNARYIRACEPQALLARLEGWLLNREFLAGVVPLAQQRMSQLADFVPQAAFLFADELGYTAELLLGQVDAPERAPERLRALQWEIEKTAAWDIDTVRGLFERMASVEDLKLKTLMPLFFVVFCGSTVALPVFDSMVLLGRDLCLRRIHHALDILTLAGVSLSGKALKRFTKDYEDRYGRQDV